MQGSVLRTLLVQIVQVQRINDIHFLLWCRRGDGTPSVGLSSFNRMFIRPWSHRQFHDCVLLKINQQIKKSLRLLFCHSRLPQERKIRRGFILRFKVTSSITHRIRGISRSHLRSTFKANPKIRAEAARRADMQFMIAIQLHNYISTARSS